MKSTLPVVIALMSVGCGVNLTSSSAASRAAQGGEPPRLALTPSIGAVRTICALSIQSSDVVWAHVRNPGVSQPRQVGEGTFMATAVEFDKKETLREESGVESPVWIYGQVEASTGKSEIGDLGDVETGLDGFAFLTRDVTGVGSVIITGGFLSKQGETDLYGNDYTDRLYTEEEIRQVVETVRSEEDCPTEDQVKTEFTGSLSDFW